MTKILVVDDDQALLRALAINLRARHFEVETASDGASALRHASTFLPDAVVLVVGLLTLLSMGRTWADTFWRPAGEARDLAAPGAPLLVAIAALSLLTIAMTIGAEPLFELTSRGARQLLQRDEYVRAVLGRTD